MTQEQIKALKTLKEAVKLATDSGLFDVIPENQADTNTANVINSFCDMLTEV